MDFKSKLYPAFYYAQYFLQSKTVHALHSPFVFDLYKNVIINKDVPKEIQDIEDHRTSLLQKKSFIDVYDLGTGKSSKRMRSISDITNFSVSGQKKCMLLYNLVSFFKPKSIIELGTSFGLTSSYMAKANPDAQIVTIEGCSQTISIAVQFFEKLEIQNIRTTNASFDVALPEVLNKNAADFIFFDGNHTKEATLKYFNMALPFAHNDSIFIFDDIHWSQSMDAAWQIIKSNPLITVSIDLFDVGIVFFKKELSKQNFVLKF